MFKFRYFCMEFSQYLCKMFSNRTHLGLMSKKKKRQDKAAQKCFCAASLCSVLLWMRKKENRLLASEYKDIGKILRKQEKNDYRSMKFLLSPDRAPRIYPLYRGKRTIRRHRLCAVLPLQTHLCRLCVKGCEQRLRSRRAPKRRRTWRTDRLENPAALLTALRRFAPAAAAPEVQRIPAR